MTLSGESLSQECSKSCAGSEHSVQKVIYG